MSYDAPGVPMRLEWLCIECGSPLGECPATCTSGHRRVKLTSTSPEAFDFGLLAAPELISGRFVLVFVCGCTRVIDRRGDFHEYPHVWVHTHFLDR
jgi:hypothetical protein